KETRRFSPLITDTLRTSQPTINYLLDDILVMAENQCCPCGSKHLIIETIEGRCDDIFVFGKKRIFPDYLRRTIVKASDKLEDYKLVQITENELILSLNPRDSVEEQKVQIAILSYLASQGIEYVEVRIEEFKKRNPGDKLRRIQSALISH
ncbi:MAG: hypothetical protein NXH75_15335, partial [Halobacteriovoraceae bacterium]|nr:hypothetical protein [Halobacteriovoraceae bacterium]